MEVVKAGSGIVQSVTSCDYPSCFRLSACQGRLQLKQDLTVLGLRPCAFIENSRIEECDEVSELNTCVLAEKGASERQLEPTLAQGIEKFCFVLV